MTDKEYLTFLPHHMPVCFCLSVYSYLSFWLYEQVYLPARSGCALCCFSKLWEVPRQQRCNCVSIRQRCRRPLRPPIVWGPLLLLSHPVIPNSFHLLLCSSLNPSIIITSYSLRSFSLFISPPYHLYAAQFTDITL